MDIYLEDKISPNQWLISRKGVYGYEVVVATISPWDPYFGFEGPSAHESFRKLEAYGYMGATVVALASGLFSLGDVVCRHRRELCRRKAA